MSIPSSYRTRLAIALGSLKNAAYELGRGDGSEMRPSLLNIADDCERECLRIYDEIDMQLDALRAYGVSR